VPAAAAGVRPIGRTPHRPTIAVRAVREVVMDEQLPTVIDALDRIKELLDDSRYAWADSTLSGILDSIDFRQTVTPGQWKAVMNIVHAVEKRQAERRGDRGSSRRDEGFDRHRR
jgi:hypothetical protein